MKFKTLSQRLWRVALVHLLVQVMVFGPPVGFMLDAAYAGGNTIITDGRTQTQIDVNGRTTDIRTRTLQGGKAFNSFSRFETGKGNTVNLHVPDKANVLVNVVRDAPVVINGTLNSYKNGKIGGNIFFADPHGFIVGSSGVVNVGSLTVTTPSAEFTESLIGPGGNISNSHVDRLLSGAFPISPDGNILIDGRINAADGVRLIGQNVFVPGAGQALDPTIRQATTFASTVNSSGLTSGGAIEVSNGSIRIVAASKARVGGKLKARRKAGSASGGRIDVLSNDTIVIDGTAVVTSTNDGRVFDGGTIIVKADNHLEVADGATFLAAAGIDGGDGGFAELSGLKTVTIGQANIDLSSQSGLAGTLLIDPEDYVLNGVFNNMGNTNVIIQASKSITISATGVIDTRKLGLDGFSIANSGNITLEAPKIDIVAGARLDASVNNNVGSNFSAGDIMLIAHQTDSVITGPATASTQINIGGVLKGGNIVASSEARAVSSYTDSAAGMALAIGSTLQSSFTGINGGYVGADATASVSVLGTADIDASGAVTLKSRGEQVANMPAITIAANRVVEAAAMFGTVEGSVTTEVLENASIKAAGGLSVFATNEAALNVTALTFANSNTTIDGAVAYGSTEISTRAAVNSGAQLTIGTGSDVVVFARNDNDFKVKATVLALGNSKAGAAIAVSDHSTNATAHLGADVGSAVAKAGNIVVEANSYTARNETSTSTTVGDGLLVSLGRKVGVPSNSVLTALGGLLVGSSKAGQNSSSSTPRFASSISVANTTTGANANVSATAGASAPELHASGNVAIYSDSFQEGVRNNASSSINSEAAAPTPDKPAATKSLSVAVAVGAYTNNSSAFIGAGADVTGGRIGVGASSGLPITLYNLKWHNANEVISNLSSVLNGNGGIVSNLLTGYADATSKGTELALAGAVNYLDINHNTTAWVARNARLTSTATTAGPWTQSGSQFPRDGGQSRSSLDAMSWDSAVTVRAKSLIESVNIGGNFSWLTFFGVGGQDPDAKAVGGAVNVNTYNANTIAGISDGVTVISSEDVAVRATSNDKLIAVAPTSGEGDGLGGNGIFTYGEIQNTTRASISNRANVTADKLAISATEAIALTNIAGAVTSQGDGAVGIGVAVSNIDTDTAAYVGDNSGDIASIDPNAGTTAAAGQKIQTNDLSISAVSAADVDTIAVAGAKAGDKDQSQPTGKVGTALAKIKGVLVSSKTKNQGTPGTFTLAAAGSSAVNISNISTQARLSGARVDAVDVNGKTRVLVQAISQADLVAASGAAAYNSATTTPNGNSVAIAGAIGVGLSSNTTLAAIDSGSNVTAADDVAVEAAAGGEQLVIGLGIALSTAGNPTKTTGAAGSVSVATVEDRVEALVDSSTIAAKTAGADPLRVTAYQKSDLGIGGGSLYASGKRGFGAAFTYALIDDPTGFKAVRAAVNNSAVTGFSSIDVLASGVGRIGAGAAVAGYAENGLAGAIVVTEIGTSTVAEITGTGSPSKQISAGNVVVRANGASASAYNVLIDEAWTKARPDLAYVPAVSDYDFDATELDLQSPATGASVTAVAGTAQFGKSNLGASVAVTTITRTHSAVVDGVIVEAGTGGVTLDATDGARITSAAVGAAIATGKFAGDASISTAIIANTTEARIGSDTSTTTSTQVTAGEVKVGANNESNLRTGSGALGASLEGNSGGVATVANKIDNTTTARISGAMVDSSKSVSVEAKSSGNIYTTAIGVAVSSKSAFAGSLATNIMGNGVSALINGGADVDARDNVGVMASNDNSISVIAGSLGAGFGATGLGASLVINLDDSNTTAQIAGAATRVDAHGDGAGLLVDTGVLATALDLGAFAAPTDNTPDLSEQTKTVSGLSVTASSAQATVANAVSIGIAPDTAIAITLVTNKMGGATTAAIDDAHINKRLGAISAANRPDIFVKGSSQSYAGTYAVAAGAAIANAMKRNTFARVNNADIGEAGAVGIDARTNAGASSVSIGVAGGQGFSLAASGIVNTFGGTTQASLAGGGLTANSLALNADQHSGFASAAGTGAGAGQSGLAASFIVNVSNMTTRALLGAGDRQTLVDVSGAIDVKSNVLNDDKSIAVGGTGAGGTGVAGMVNVAVYDNTTEARITRTELNKSTGAAGSGDVTVEATENFDLGAYVGGVALGGQGGIGASFNLIMFKSATVASVTNSALNIASALSVNTSGNKTVDALTFTGGAGGSVGVGAAVGVLLMGDDVSGNAASGEYTGSLTAAQNAGADADAQMDAADGTTGDSPSTFDVAGTLGGNFSDGLTAEIAGGEINASSVSVTASGVINTSNVVVGAGLGGKVGVGAAVGYTGLKNNVLADIHGATVDANSVTVTAGLANGSTPIADAGNRAAYVKAGAGGGGLYAGLGAAIAIADTKNNVVASAGGTLRGTGTGNAAVNAQDTTNAKSWAIGVAVAGFGGVGVSAATTDKDSTVAAGIGQSSTVRDFNRVDVTATNAGSVEAVAKAGAGGVGGAGAGAGSHATDTSRISALVGSGANITIGSGGLNLTARGSPDTDADSFGVAIAGGAALGVSVALANANLEVAAGVGDDAVLSGGTLAILAENTVAGGGDSAKAHSIAGAGGFSIAANAAVATAESSGTVRGFIGDRVQLTDGDIRINANSTTSQNSDATGVSVGYLALGATVTYATSDVDTKIDIGSGVVSSTFRSGDIILAANGVDTNQASSTAGSGGIYSGAASIARTTDTSTAKVNVAAGAALVGGLVSISAQHTDNYKAKVNSLSAAAVGASGADAKHSATTTAQVTIGNDVIISSRGADPMTVSAQSNFNQVGSGDSAKAAAGGAINGSAALSRADITATTKVVYGDRVTLRSGADPVNSPGGIITTAVSHATINDTVSLTTGGLIQGAGVNSTVNATFNNTVVTGVSNDWQTWGEIQAGTYSLANVRTDSAVSTYGLAGVGVAVGETILTSNDTVTIGGGGTVLRGFGNVNLTPGRIGGGSFETTLIAQSNATGYVRALIAIPDATATARSYANATLTVASGASIESAQNVILGGYHGFLQGSARGVGHGYQLFFIPTSQSDSRSSTSSNARVDIDGSVTAGIYHDLNIVIDCGTAACGPNSTPVITQISGAPMIASYNPTFDAAAYVNANYDPDVAATLLAGVQSTGTVKAISLSQLFAAGGTVTINADTITGSGSLTSYGGPTIRVVNNSAAYLLLDGGAYIPNTPGAQIIYTGAAGAAQAGSLTIATHMGSGPNININNAYAGASVGSSGFGPALFVAGGITNIGGGVVINNETGSYGLTGNINAQQVNITIPEGAVAISSPGPNGRFTAGSSPFSEWRNVILYPGGNPANGMPDPLEGIIYGINLLHPSANRDALNAAVYSTAGAGEPNNEAYVYFGACGVPIMGNCSRAFATSQIPLSYYDSPTPSFINPFSGDPILLNYYNLSSQSDYALIPHRSIGTRTFSYASADLTGSAASAQIFGGQVAIKATTININGRIEAGRPTDWSLDLAASLTNVGGAIYNARLAKAASGVGRRIEITDSVTTTRAGDAKIKVFYDSGLDQVVVDDVSASSGGGFVLLDGRIVSTNTYGHIHINGGLGDVEINNATNVGLVVNQVSTGSLDAGSAPVSTVKIVDRLKAASSNTLTLRYTPGSGIVKYVTANGADPILTGPGATAGQVLGSDATSYAPTVGARFQWSLQATLGRDILTYGSNGLIDTMSNWTWRSGTANNPWQFVGANGFGLYPDNNPQGGVVIDPGKADFVQTISASRTSMTSQGIRYHGCFVPFAVCNYGFAMTGLHDENHGGDPYGRFVYRMPLRVQLNMTNSVKADNTFGIDFAGNAQSSVVVNSLGSVVFNKQVANAGGNMSVTSQQGSITQAGDEANVLTQDLNLNAAQGIGSASRSFKASLAAGSTLNATAGNQGVYLDLNSGARVGTVRAGSQASGWGDIKISANNDLTRGTGAGGVNIAGRDISITSTNGAIGSLSDPLVISAHSTALANGSVSGGVVSASALRDIGLTETGGGDMRIEQIRSLTGDVKLTVNGGAIIDARGQTGAGGLSQQQLDDLSARLRLTDADGAAAYAVDVSVTPFETTVISNYHRYYRLLDNGSVTGGVYELANDKVALYRPLVKDALGLTTEPTDQQVKDFTRDQYDSLVPVFEQAYGTDWSSQAVFHTEDTNFTFTASPELRAQLTNDAVWERGQLVSAIDASALQPASGVVGNADPMIVGRNVEIVASGDIGSLAEPIAIDIDDLKDGNITAAQQAGLAVATAPGSVLGVGRDADGLTVTGIDLLNVPAGVTVTGVSVVQTSPAFVNASGTFRATSSGDVYVQSTSGPVSAGATLTVGHVSAAGDVSLSAPDAILGAPATATAGIDALQVTATGNLSLTAGNGAIGTGAVPFSYTIGGSLLAVSAGTDAYLRAVGRGMVVGRVFAQGLASLHAPDGDIVGNLPGVSLSAFDARLVASGNIGANGNPFEVQLNKAGTLTGSAGLAAYVYAPTITGQPTAVLHVDGFTAQTAALSSDGDLSLDNVSTSIGVLTASAGQDLRITNTSSAAALTATSLRDATVGGVSSVGKATVNAAGDVTVTADGSGGVQASAVEIDGASLSMAAATFIRTPGLIDIDVTADATLGNLESTTSGAGDVQAITVSAGRILSNGDGQMNAVATGANALTNLVGTSGIGQASLPMKVASQALTASATSGGIYIDGFGAFEARSLTARDDIVVDGDAGVIVTTANSSNGNIDVTAAQNLNAGTITAGSSAVLTSAGGDIAANTVTAVQNVVVGAPAGAVSVNSVTGTNGNVDVSALNTVDLMSVVSGAWTRIVSVVQNIVVGTVTSGGDQTLTGETSVVFNTLESTGGSIGVTSNTADVTGTTIAADRNVTVGALAGAVSVNSVSGTNGNVDVSALNTVDLVTTTAGGNVNLTSTVADLALGSVDAGNDLTFNSQLDTVFTRLAAGRDLTGIAEGAIRGGSFTAGNNVYLKANGIFVDDGTSGQNMTLNSSSDVVANDLTAGRVLTIYTGKGGNLTVGQIKASQANLFSHGVIRIGGIEVARGLSMAATEMFVHVRQTPGGTNPLHLNITGPDGGVAKLLDLTVATPNGIRVDQFRVVDANFVTNASNVSFTRGFVPGQLWLKTAHETILMNNRSGVPTGTAGVQLFQPGYGFKLSVKGRRTVTDTYVVDYGPFSSVTVTNYAAGRGAGNFYTGSSMVRNFIRMQRNEQENPALDNLDPIVLWDVLAGLVPFSGLDLTLPPNPVDRLGTGPAVNF